MEIMTSILRQPSSTNALPTWQMQSARRFVRAIVSYVRRPLRHIAIALESGFAVSRTRVLFLFCSIAGMLSFLPLVWPDVELDVGKPHRVDLYISNRYGNSYDSDTRLIISIVSGDSLEQIVGVFNNARASDVNIKFASGYIRFYYESGNVRHFTLHPESVTEVSTGERWALETSVVTAVANMAFERHIH